MNSDRASTALDGQTHDASARGTRGIFAATLNGELVVFKQTNGVVDPKPLFRKVVPGGIGAFNSIVVADLEPDSESKPQVYIAGSSGLRRFDFQ